MKKFKHNSDIEIGYIALNTSNLLDQKDFYEKVLGLKVLYQSDSIINLGTDNATLIKLIKVTSVQQRKEAGLFHTALLLPSKEEVSKFFSHLYHFHNIPMGASDHGYSEAIYIEDVDGNGIEVYCDTPESIWDRDEVGNPIGKTERLNLSELLLEKHEVLEYKIHNDSKVGHVHLKVIDAKKTSKLYQKIFPISQKDGDFSVSFMAGGDYHHHIAVNQWEPNLYKRSEDSIGLAYIEILLRDDSLLDKIYNLTLDDVSITKKDSCVIIIDDLNGIKFIVKSL